MKKSTTYMEESVPVPKEIRLLIKRLSLPPVTEATGMTSNRLRGLSSGNYKNIKRFEIKLLQDYVETHINTIGWLDV